jgi:formamidase
VGTARLLDIPARPFYATTGCRIKAAGGVPTDMAYLESDNAVGLENLSKDVSLAARNALLEKIEYISSTYGFSRDRHISSLPWRLT